MNKLILYSKEPISDADKNKIKQIFEQSNNPHESLISSVERYSFMQGHQLFFDGLEARERSQAPCEDYVYFNANDN